MELYLVDVLIISTSIAMAAIVGKLLRCRNSPKKNRQSIIIAVSFLASCVFLSAFLIIPPVYHFEPTGFDANWPYTIEVPSGCQLQVGIHYHTHLRYIGQEITNLYHIECGDTTINTKIHAKWNNSIYSSIHTINCSSTTLSFSHIWDYEMRIPENGQDPDIFHHSFTYSILHYWS